MRLLGAGLPPTNGSVVHRRVRDGWDVATEIFDDEILKEMRLAIMEAGRKLAIHLRKKRRLADAERKKDYIKIKNIFFLRKHNNK